MRLIYSFPLLLVSVFGCQTPNRGLEGQGLDGEHVRVLKIYHTNDIHGHLGPDSRGRGGLAYLASVLKLVRQVDHESLILDAGDFYRKGSLPAQKSNDEVTADMMSVMPYWDARVVGNNELKVGISRLIEWAKSKEHAPLLSANFVDRENKPVFQPSLTLSRNGLKIGIIGLTEPVTIESEIQADPKKDPRAPYTIIKPEEVVEPIIKEMRPRVDVLIILSHQVFSNNVKFLASHPEVDLIVSGHSHIISGEQKKHGTGMVVEAGQFGAQVGAINLVYNTSLKKVIQIESAFWPVGEGLQVPDQILAARIQEAYAKWAPQAFEQIGSAEDEFGILDPDHPFEAPLNDWASDVFCQTMNCDVSFVNRELIREPIYKGIIDKESVFFAVPYNDHIALVTVDKTKLEKMLTAAIKKYFEKTGLMEFAFHGISARLLIHDHVLKKVKLKWDTDKEKLKVALPLYLATHCVEFFSKDQCPFGKVEKDMDTKMAFEIDIVKENKLYPPPLDRVVIKESILPEAVSSDDETPDLND